MPRASEFVAHLMTQVRRNVRGEDTGLLRTCSAGVEDDRDDDSSRHVPKYRSTLAAKFGCSIHKVRKRCFATAQDYTRGHHTGPLLEKVSKLG
eukprot:4084415-Amphidinium_carterae.1